MITHAHISETLQPTDPHDQTKITRGDPKFRLGVTDLLRFGDSPRRWLLTPPPTDPPKPRHIQLLRCMLLAAGALPANYIRRNRSQP